MIKTTPADLEKPTNLNAARLIIHPLQRAGFAGDARPSEAVFLSRFPFLDCAEGGPRDISALGATASLLGETVTISTHPAPSAFSARSLERQAACEKEWAAINAGLAGLGVKAALFGSIARGEAKPLSDLDILVLDRGATSRGAVVCAIDDASTGIPCDLIFAEDISPGKVHRMLGEARLGRMGYALSVAGLDGGKAGIGRP